MDTKFSDLPDAPGCYIFWDSAGDCLYVGKSKNIKSRVRSYFNKSNPPKIQKLSKLICKIEYRSTKSELDALFLEHGLIKTYRPPFNSQMKKDFHPHYICIDWDQALPGLYIHTNPKAKAARYGGFYSVYDAREAIEIINSAWGTPICENTHFDNVLAKKSCLNHHIGRCLGPCSLPNSDYKQVLLDVTDFLQGKNNKALRKIKEEMTQAATNFDYEKAARQRDIINQLYILQKRVTNQISFKNKKIWVFIKGHHEDSFRFIYFSNSNLVHTELYINTDDFENKRMDTINLIISPINNDDKSQEMATMYTTLATQEIRAVKYYVDVTKTPKTKLAHKFDKAVTHFIENH